MRYRHRKSTLHRKARHRAVSLLAGILVATLAVLLASGPARATHGPASTIEQHFELLAETATGVTANRDIGIARGSVPGATTQFDPQPTVTLEVVAQHVSGASGSSWQVALKNPSGTQIASVSFGATDTAMQIKTASFTWPTTDTALSTISLTRSSSAGTLNLRKAYLKIRQTGTITKTVGRVPIAIKQTGIAPVGVFADVANPPIYRHSTADFDPAPTIRLRATGLVSFGGTLAVRLVDGSGSAVTSSQLSFNSSAATSQETSGLTLSDATEYRLQVQTTGSGATGDLIGADLMFEQSTSDTHGLTKSIGWYPSVTASTDMTTDGADLGFLANAPSINSPSSSPCFKATIRRLSGSGTVGVRLRNITGNAIEATTATTTSSTFNLVEAPSVSTATAGDDLDTRVSLGSGTTGRVVQSLLCRIVQLRDTVPPVISSFTVSTTPFSPNGDGTKDTTTFSGTIVDYSSVTWSVAIKNSSGTTIKTYTGSVASVSATWDGSGRTGDGTYTAELTATDAAGNATTSGPINVVVDTIGPAISDYVISPTPFSPNGDG